MKRHADLQICRFSLLLFLLFFASVCSAAADATSDNTTSPPGVNAPRPSEDGSGDNETLTDDDLYDPFAFDDTFGFSESQPGGYPDPIEGFNRATFAINDTLYVWLLKPAGIGFKYLLYPKQARKSLRKCFLNLAFPRRFLNCIFQLKMKGAGTELTRFLVNTTIGIAGLFDPATRFFHISPRDEDTGQTFGHYGMGAGCYLVVPIIIGPSTVRDAFGGLFDLAMTPYTYLPGAGLLMQINDISLGVNPYEDLKKASLDPYVGIRNAYLQHRENVLAR